MNERTKKLVAKLQNACVCCKDCGSKYGVYSVGCSSTWIGTCRVCDRRNVPVTETRDYGYLVTGIHRLLTLPEDELERIVLEYPEA